MVSENVKKGAACVFISISCAAIAVSTLLIYDVIKIGKSTTDKTAFLKRTTTQASASSTTKIPTELRTSPGIRTTAVHRTRDSVRRSRVTRTDGGEKVSSDRHKRRDASSTGVGKRHGSNPDGKNATKGTFRGTRQFSRATESTAAKVTKPKRRELPRQTTSGGDLLEAEKAVTNGTADKGVTDTGTASGVAERTKMISHGDVSGISSKADEKATSKGHSQPALVDSDNNTQTGYNNEVFVSASSLSYGTSDTNRTFSDETYAGTARDVSISVTVNDTKPPFAPNELTAKAVPREAPTSTTRAVTQAVEGEAFETVPDDGFYGTTEEPRWEGRMGGEVRATNRLLCTAGSRASSEEMLPPDGLCDLMFYTDVVWQDGALRGVQNKESWEAFQAAAAAATRSGHGLSVDYGRANDLYGSLTTPLGRQKLRELFFKNVVHYGILKATGTVAQLLEDMHGKLTLLKALKQLQEKFMSEVPMTKQRLDVALGVRFTTYDSPDGSKHHSAAMTAMSNHLPVTIFIVHTHIADWETGRYPLIGTLWNHGQEETNVVSAPSLLRTARDLNAGSIPPRTCVMASFTLMVGEFHKVKISAKNVLSAGSLVIKDFSKLCSRKTGVLVVNKALVKLYSDGYNRTYVYDDAETMTAKAVAFFKLYQHVRQGWAVFDTEFEDYDDTCGNGTFSRLKAFKAKLGA